LKDGARYVSEDGVAHNQQEWGLMEKAFEDISHYDEQVRGIGGPIEAGHCDK
jgi:hypothetical protein